MRPSDELRYDHEVLRAKLSMLERYLPVGRECSCTLSRLADSLASCLRFHAQREERLLAALALRHRELAEPTQRLHDEHENQRTRLAILHELFTQPEPALDERTAAQVSSLLNDLREHIAAEEACFFPLIDQERSGPGECAAGAGDDQTAQCPGFVCAVGEYP